MAGCRVMLPPTIDTTEGLVDSLDEAAGLTDSRTTSHEMAATAPAAALMVALMCPQHTPCSRPAQEHAIGRLRP